MDLSSSAEELVPELAGTTRVVELPGGRVAMMEPYLPSLTILDPATGVVSRFGRSGNGPGEFGMPSPVLALHPDTLAVVADIRGRNLHIFTNWGQYVRTMQLPAGPFYVSAELFAANGWLILSDEGSGARDLQATIDSFGVVRGRPGEARVDSIWAIGVTPRRRVALDVGSTLMAPAFSDRDRIGVSATGRIYRVSAAQQTIMVWEDGRERTLGSPWGIPPEPVTDADRDSVQQHLGAIHIYKGIKPTFADRKTVVDLVHVTPDGEVWVRLTRPREGRLVYRVFSSEGIPQWDVAPPPGAAVGGFGASHIFLLLENEEGRTSLWRALRP